MIIKTIIIYHLYQGAAKNRSGDNLEAGLLFANNDLAMNYAQEAVLNKYYVEIFVSVVNPATLEPKQIYGNYFLTRDNWLAASMSYDFETIPKALLDEVEKEFTKEYHQVQNKIKTIIQRVMGDTPINLSSPEQLSWMVYSKKVVDKKVWSETFNIGIDKASGRQKRRKK